MANETNTEVDLTPIGPGAIPEDIAAPKPLLDGKSETDYVVVLNPLSQDFIAKFGVTRPVRADVRVSQAQGVTSASQSVSDVRNNYGLDLNNPDHPGQTNIANTVRIKAGNSIRVFGNEAQVIVRQLVNEIMQREGKTELLADPTARRTYEERIILQVGSVTDILDRTQLNSTEPTNAQEEQEFPGARGNASTSQGGSNQVGPSPAPNSGGGNQVIQSSQVNQPGNGQPSF